MGADDGEQAHYLPLSEQAGNQQAPAQAAVPSREDVLNYLGHLADDYHLPRKLVYAVADTESSVNPNIPHPNYAKKNGKFVYEENGNKKIVSWDYGLMQVNSSNIFHVDARRRDRGLVKDAHGHPFKIAEDVKTDWRANARAGVALLVPAYRLAELEQGPGATAEDHAQQAYSQYNGTENTRDRYLKQRRDGMPQNDADRNFLEKYQRHR